VISLGPPKPSGGGSTQGCAWYEWVICGSAIAACVPICGPNIACYAACLPFGLGFCAKCVTQS
jgi:hypothetical protein